MSREQAISKVHRCRDSCVSTSQSISKVQRCRNSCVSTSQSISKVQRCRNSCISISQSISNAQRCRGCWISRMQSISRGAEGGEGGSDLHTDANRPVAHVGPASRLHRVVVDVNDLVQVLGHLLCDLRKLGKVKIPAYTSVVTSSQSIHWSKWQSGSGS